MDPQTFTLVKNMLETLKNAYSSPNTDSFSREAILKSIRKDLENLSRFFEKS